MTDQIPADKVRKIATAMRAAMHRDDPEYNSGRFLAEMSDYIRDLHALLPTPPPPTLADMTPEERRECTWMQADVEDEDTRAVIVNPYWTDGSARVMWPGAFIEQIDWKNITPRPDLPRLEWPTDEGDDSDD